MQRHLLCTKRSPPCTQRRPHPQQVICPIVCTLIEMDTYCVHKGDLTLIRKSVWFLERHLVSGNRSDFPGNYFHVESTSSFLVTHITHHMSNMPDMPYMPIMPCTPYMSNIPIMSIMVFSKHLFIYLFANEFPGN
jgi:hypothetical protein